MNRSIIILTVVLVGGLITLLVWVQSGASKRQDYQDELMKDGGKAARRGNAAPTANLPPKERPRRQSDVLLQLTLPEDDRRSLSGGPVVCSVRGNGVAFLRRDVASPKFTRVRLKVNVVTQLLDRAQDPAGRAPTDGVGLHCRYNTGRTKGAAWIREDEALALMELAEGKTDVGWAPPALRLRMEPCDPPEKVALWPGAGLEPPENFAGEGGEIRGTKKLRQGLLQVLAPGRAFRADGVDDCFKVVAFEVVLP